MSNPSVDFDEIRRRVEGTSASLLAADRTRLVTRLMADHGIHKSEVGAMDPTDNLLTNLCLSGRLPVRIGFFVGDVQKPPGMGQLLSMGGAIKGQRAKSVEKAFQEALDHYSGFPMLPDEVFLVFRAKSTMLAYTCANNYFNVNSIPHLYLPATGSSPGGGRLMMDLSSFLLTLSEDVE